LVLIYSELSGLSIAEVLKKFKGIGYAPFKADLAEVIVEALKPLQERRERLFGNPKKVMEILEEGAERVRPIAQKTLLEVKRKIGLI